MFAKLLYIVYIDCMCVYGECIYSGLDQNSNFPTEILMPNLPTTPYTMI